MREDWPRSRPVLDLDSTTVEGLIAPYFPGCRIVEMVEVAGGLTNTNLRLRLAHRSVPLLLRFYQRSGDLAHKEMALCQMVAHRVRVPAYLHYAPENPVTGHAFALMDWIEAKSLQDLFTHLDAEDLPKLGAALGRMLAAIHGFTYERFGFFTADLGVGPAMDLSGRGLVDYLRFCLVEGPGGERLGSGLTRELLAFAAEEGHRVEEWQATSCLVHGDLNPSNILIRPLATGGFEIAALIDWEYAFAGAPGFDFGNLLRPPVDSVKPFIAALEDGYRAAGGVLPPDWRRIARITDLFSLADVLHHPETSGAVIADAKGLVRRLLASAD